MADRLHTLAYGLRIVAEGLRSHVRRQRHAMKAIRYRRMPLSDFLMDVSNLAPLVSLHAKRLGLASQGRINARTAKEMLRIADEVRRIHSERLQIAIPSARDLVAHAQSVTSEIRAAAKYLAARDPVFAEKLDRTTGSGPRRRGAAASAFALEMHLGLLREHERELAALLPADTRARAEQILGELRERDATIRKQTEAAVQCTARRDALIAELDRIVRDVRALAAVLFRAEPQVAGEFERRAARRRARPRTAHDPEET